jgi:hypothetical protein
MSFHPEILTVRQQRTLRLLGPAVSARGFYLGGGTAIAIQLGHRRSVDFDWFLEGRISDPLLLARELQDEVPFVTSGIEPRTLFGTLNGVRVSFFEFRYPSLAPGLPWPDYGCRLASLQDLACMKLSALVQRGSKKDFVDLFALGKEGVPLREMLTWYQARFGVEDIGHVLYALAYFDDADAERMPGMHWKVGWKDVKDAIRSWTRETGV